MDIREDVKKTMPKEFLEPEENKKVLDEEVVHEKKEVPAVKKTLKSFINQECRWENINRFVFSSKRGLPEDQVDSAIASCRGELFEEDIILLLVFDDDDVPIEGNPYLADVVCGRGRTGMAFTEDKIVYWENGKHVFSYKYIDIKSVEISTSSGEYGIGDENDYVEICTLQDESYMFGCSTHDMNLKNVPKFYNFLMRVVKFKRDEMDDWEAYAQENTVVVEEKTCSRTAEDFRNFLLSRDNSDVGEYVVGTDNPDGRFKEFYAINRRKIKEEDVLFITINYYDDYQGMEHAVYTYFTDEAMYVYRVFIDKSNKLKKETIIRYEDIIDVETSTHVYSRTTDYYLYIVSSEMDDVINKYYTKMENKHRRTSFGGSLRLFDPSIFAGDERFEGFKMGWDDENARRIPGKDEFIDGEHGGIPVGGHVLYQFDWNYESEGIYNLLFDLIEFKEE